MLVLYLVVAPLIGWPYPKKESQDTILGLTLIVLILYTYSNLVLARYARLAQSPNVGYRMERVFADPATGKIIDSPPRNRQRRFRCQSTWFYLINQGSVWIKVYVRLNLTVSGQPVLLYPFYTGDSYWTLSAHQTKRGHFEIHDIISRANIPPDDVFRLFRGDPRGFVKMNLELEYVDPNGISYKNLPQEHYFDFNSMQWQILDVGPIPEG
jgi:hypothetical protein